MSSTQNTSSTSSVSPSQSVTSALTTVFLNVLRGFFKAAQELAAQTQDKSMTSKGRFHMLMESVAKTLEEKNPHAVANFRAHNDAFYNSPAGQILWRTIKSIIINPHKLNQLAESGIEQQKLNADMEQLYQLLKGKEAKHSANFMARIAITAAWYSLLQFFNNSSLTTGLANPENLRLGWQGIAKALSQYAMSLSATPEREQLEIVLKRCDERFNVAVETLQPIFNMQEEEKSKREHAEHMAKRRGERELRVIAAAKAAAKQTQEAEIKFQEMQKQAEAAKQEAQELVKKLAATEKKSQELARKLAAADQEEQKLTTKLVSAAQKITELTQKIAVIEKKSETTEKVLHEKDAQIVKLQQKVTVLKQELITRFTEQKTSEAKVTSRDTSPLQNTTMLTASSAANAGLLSSSAAASSVPITHAASAASQPNSSSIKAFFSSLFAPTRANYRTPIIPAEMVNTGITTDDKPQLR